MIIKQLTVFLILLLILPLSLNFSLPTKAVTAETSPGLYVGVDVAFESIAETEQLIDNIRNYTNFFVIGCYGGYNETRLTIISQYVYNNNLTFIVYTDNPRYPSKQWLEDAQNNWGNSFLGIYFYDEPGGKQLDQSNYPVIEKADNNSDAPDQYVTTLNNYSDAANQYVSTLNLWLRSGPYSITQSFPSSTKYQLFTSDYSLYWYDYEAGYDTVFAEFALNYDRTINIDLCRGAAAVQNKDWGIMITNAYLQWPFMESGPDLYNDMKLAYENGAKYIIVFDSDLNWTQNVLQQEHLIAMNQFWDYALANPRTISPVSDRSVYVLPEDYAYGFRAPTEDSIWGLWNNDSLTLDVGMSMAALFKIFGNNLDIVYPDGLQTIESMGYRNVIYWNDSRLVSNLPPMQSPSPVKIVNAWQPSLLPHLNRSVSWLSYATSVYFYSIAMCFLVAVAVASTVLKFKIKRQ
jgi:hypothetical protein